MCELQRKVKSDNSFTGFSDSLILIWNYISFIFTAHSMLDHALIGLLKTENCLQHCCVFQYISKFHINSDFQMLLFIIAGQEVI